MDYLLNAYDYFRPGGFIIVLLMVISLWMWGLIFERWMRFWAMDRQDVDLSKAIVLLNHDHSAQVQRGICATLGSGFQSVRTGDSRLDQHMLDQCAMRLKPLIQRFLTTIAILATTAPLLGLLGTVTGMVTTFDVIAVFGTGNAKALSAGISKALITTQGGLLVGIPGLLMSRLLNRRAHAIERRLTEAVIALKRIV